MSRVLWSSQTRENSFSRTDEPERKLLAVDWKVAVKATRELIRSGDRGFVERTILLELAGGGG